MKRTPEEDLRSFTVAALFLAVLCFFHIHQGTLSVDGIRYAAVARSLIDGGSFFELFDDYAQQPYLNKPPFLFWFIAGSIKLFGLNTFAVKLPGALFAFTGMLLLFVCVRRHFKEGAALAAVALFAGNAVFFRSVVDAGFEGWILCGAVLVLDGLLSLLRGCDLSWKPWARLGAGLAFTAAAKPAYLVLFALPIAFCFFSGRKPRPGRPIDGLVLLAPLLTVLSWPAFVFVQGRLGTTLENQVVEPLTLSQGWSKNFLAWLLVTGAYFAPLSLVGAAAVKRLLLPAAKRDRTAIFLILWLLPVPFLILFAVCRARYLVAPFVGLSAVAAEYLLLLSPRFGPRVLERVLLGAAAAAAAAILLFGVQFHRVHPIIGALSLDPALRESRPLICVGSGKFGDVPHPSKRRTELLLDLHFGMESAVVEPDMLDPADIAPGHRVLLDERCFKQLAPRGWTLKIDKRLGGALLVEIDASKTLMRAGAQEECAENAGQECGSNDPAAGGEQNQFSS